MEIRYSCTFFFCLIIYYYIFSESHRDLLLLCNLSLFEWQERLMAMAKAVANATAALVMAAKETSDTCEGKAEQSRIIDSARQCGLATSQLVACTKVLAPTIASSPECQEQFADAVKQVASFVDEVVETAEVSCQST